MRVGSLFTGCGGLDLGLERAGHEVAWQSEIWGPANKVLAARWPDVPNLGNVEEVVPGEASPVDVLAGGFP